MIRARTTQVRLAHEGARLCLLDEATGQAHALSPEAATLWQAADGRDAAALLAAVQAEHPQVTRRALWRLVDDLADAGWLTGAPPPASLQVDRRQAVAALGAAAAAVVFGLRPARAQDAAEADPQPLTAEEEAELNAPEEAEPAAPPADAKPAQRRRHKERLAKYRKRAQRRARLRQREAAYKRRRAMKKDRRKAQQERRAKQRDRRQDRKAQQAGRKKAAREQHKKRASERQQKRKSR